MKINTVVQGDCMTVLEYMEPETVDLILTDPPYDVDYGKRSTDLAKHVKVDGLKGINGSKRMGSEDDITRDQSYVTWNCDYDKLCSEFFKILKDNSHIYLFCGDKQIGKWYDSLVKAGFKRPQVLVWRKDGSTFDMTFGHKFPENKEFIIYSQKGWKKLNGYKIERKNFRTVLDFPSQQDNKHHPCEKPMNLLYYLIKLSSNKGDTVFDCFAGSGNHLLASKRLGRNFIGVEMSVEYQNNIIKRLDDDEKQDKLEKWFNEKE